MRNFLIFLISFITVFVIVTICYSAEQSVGVYGGNQNGHSYSTTDKVNPPGYEGQSAVLSYERYKKPFNCLQFSYGLSAYGYHFKMRDNRTMEVEDTYAVTPFFVGRTYLLLDKIRLRPYVGVGGGWEFGTDRNDASVMVDYGAEVRIYKGASLVIGETKMTTKDRKHQFTYVGVKVRF